MFYKNYLKRLFDIIFSLILLVVLSPVFVALSAALALANKNSPFFVQKRPGKFERIFLLIKFKTMNDDKDENGILLPDASRITRLGNFIRSASLDEIPQLINVLKGDMSIIGPRPLLIEYLPYYNSRHRKRHNIRPGITGLAQVNGRNKIKFSDRFNFDVYYVENVSFILDCKILIKTIINIFNRKNIMTGQFAEDVDDIGLTKDLPSNYFKTKQVKDAHRDS